MPNEKPHPIGESIEEVFLRITQPDLLAVYQKEKERHREEKRQIEQAMKRARHFLKRLFGPVLEHKRAELEAEHSERV